jgi:hypothetical protein
LHLKEESNPKKSEMQECKEQEFMAMFATKDSGVDCKRYLAR